MNNTDVAIIGISGIFPDAKNLEEFYDNLCSRKDSVKEPTRERLIYSSYDPNKDYKLAGHLNRVDLFDHKFFNISKKEAEFIEPSQRIALELACEAIENAGYCLEEFKGSNTGIYMGSNNMAPFIYLQNVNASFQNIDPTIHTGTLGSMAFGRIAYALQLAGPAVMVDTGCSSSLVAISEACEKLALNKIDYGLVGAVNLKLLFFEKGKGAGHLGAASEDGKSRAFDADANGIGVGEGGGMILLKRLDRALNDNDHIHAVIKGIGLSQDGGRSNSITAPSPVAQTSAITNAWRAANIAPETIRYVEAHGAGTQLGDVIEFQALTDAFSAFSEQRSFCAVSSVKSNVGHLGNAAGMASMIKGVLSLKYKGLLPTIHFDKPNPFIDFKNSGAYINATFKEWEAEAHPRRCGVSCFGLSGTNAHLVLEEKISTPPVHNEVEDGECFLKISAKSTSALNIYIDRIADFVAASDLPMKNIAYTLNKGRDDYFYRIGICGKNKKDVLRQLSQIRSQRDLKSILPIRQKNKKVICLFSSEPVNEALFLERIRECIFISEIVTEVQQVTGSEELSQNLKDFAVGYGLYKQLLSFGVPVRTVIGTGIGSVTTKLITGTLEFKEAVAEISQYQISESSLIEGRFKTTVKELLNKEPSVFLEMGSTGIFSEKLKGYGKEIKSLELESFTVDSDRSFLKLFSSLYSYGVAINWNTYYSGNNYSKIEAPTYPFDKIRCWYEEPFKEVVANVEDWFYEIDWVAFRDNADTAKLHDQVLLVFSDQLGLSEAVTKKLGTDNTCITVQFSQSYRETATGNYEIDAEAQEDLTKLKESLGRRGIDVHGIVWLSNYLAPYSLQSSNCEALLSKHFLRLYSVLQTFARQLQKKGFQVTAVTTNAHRVTQMESTLIPLNGMTGVLLKSVLAEYPMLKTTCVDFLFGESNEDEVAERIVEEMSHTALIRFAAIRESVRYVPRLSTAKFNAADIQKSFQLKSQGIYIITGGLTGLGLETCRMLTEQGTCKLLIVGRTALPDRREWPEAVISENDESIVSRINAIHELETTGSSVEYYQADVGNWSELSAAFSRIFESHRKIDGVIHASGLGSSGVPLVNRNLEDVKATLYPKVSGTVYLEELTRTLEPDFFILFSSIATLVPSRNSVDYSSANAFEDVFAHQMQLRNKRFISINWSDWKETGLAYRKKLNQSTETVTSRESLIQGISNVEGKAAIKCAMALQKPQWAVAKTDLSSFAINPFFILNIDESPVAESGVVPALTECSAVDQALSAEETSSVDYSIVRTLTDEKLTATEASVMLIWHNVLKLDTVRLDDDFYEVGGHSLNIMQLLNLVKKRLALELGFEEILHHSTIRKLALRIDLLLREGNSVEYESIVRLPDQEYYDVSHAQKRFWLLNQFNGKEAYNVPAAYIFKGDINIPALEKAFQSVISRHESLRTSFLVAEGQPKQKIHDADSVIFKLNYLDLRQDPTKRKSVREIVKKEAAEPFDLTKVPLVRALLIHQEDQLYTFVMTMHHIVSDARSITILKNEVLKYYKICCGHFSPPLTPLPVQYRDFAAWQNGQLQKTKFDDHKSYWAGRLKGGLQNLQFPVDFNNANHHSKEGDKVIFSLSDSVRHLRKLAEKNGTTLFVVTLAAFNVLLSKYTAGKDITLGSPVSGRAHSDLEDQIGIYLNTLLLRNVIDENNSFLNFLVEVKENTIKDFQHQLYPYDLLPELIQAHQSESNLFNVGFTWSIKNTIDEALYIDFEINEYDTGFIKAKTDLWLLLSESAEDLQMQLVFKNSLFKKESIELLADRFKVLVEQIIASPDTLISDLHIKLPFEFDLERQTLNVDFNF